MYKKTSIWEIMIPFLIIVLIIWWIIKLATLGYWNKTITEELIVEANIEIINSNEWTKRKKYLFTDENIYEIEDRIFIWHTRSMDIYRKLKVNEWNICEITTIWNRIWFFSMYKTVINVECNK
jgi:hypothetical protein